MRRKPHNGLEGRHPRVPPARRSRRVHLAARTLEMPTGQSWPPASQGCGWDGDRLWALRGSALLLPRPLLLPLGILQMPGWHRDGMGAGATLAGGTLPPARSVIKQSEQRHLTKSSRHPGRPPSSTAVICQGECLPITGTSLLFYCELYKDKKKGWA